LSGLLARKDFPLTKKQKMTSIQSLQHHIKILQEQVAENRAEIILLKDSIQTQKELIQNQEKLIENQKMLIAGYESLIELLKQRYPAIQEELELLEKPN